MSSRGFRLLWLIAMLVGANLIGRCEGRAQLAPQLDAAEERADDAEHQLALLRELAAAGVLTIDGFEVARSPVRSCPAVPAAAITTTRSSP